MNLLARFAEDERIPPEPLTAFTVDIEGIDIRMGPLELVARDTFRLSCRWDGPFIGIDCIEFKLDGEWETLDGHYDPAVGTVCRAIRQYYESPNGQRALRAACDAQESDMAWEDEG